FQIFTAVLDPLNQAVQLSATQLHSPIDVAVFTLNCLSAINSAIMLYQFTDSRLEMIKAQIDANIDVLVSEQATFIITQTGLIKLYRKASAHQPSQGALSEIAGMEPSQISSTLLSFDTFLTNPNKYKSDQCVKISSARLRDTVRERTIETVVAAYRIIYNKVIDPSNKYSQLPIKTVEQVRNLRAVPFLHLYQTILNHISILGPGITEGMDVKYGTFQNLVSIFGESRKFLDTFV
ncbi:unnamed protein product, partial [Brugia timori]|uniref:Conserved oligomeric Golgi complex subunit 6 n=1 Tax=Brugia timori TaxID=42155 RepID=A0A0R3Q9W5_9BILA